MCFRCHKWPFYRSAAEMDVKDVDAKLPREYKPAEIVSGAAAVAMSEIWGRGGCALCVVCSVCWVLCVCALCV